MWRAPEGPEGLAAVPVGGGGAWPGFEPTHKHTSAHQVPLVWRAPGGPDGARNTSGGASNTINEAGRRPTAQPGPTAGPSAPGTPARDEWAMSV